MDGPGEHHAKWNKPARERQIAYDLTHMWKLMYKLNSQAKQRQTPRASWELWGSGWEMEGSSKKEKGLMDMDNSVVIAGGRRYKGTLW